MDLEQTKQLMLKQLAQLTERAREIDEALDAPNDDDWAENAAESSGDEVMENLGEDALEQIQRIKAALARIEAGKYGVCVQCRKAIAPRRLEALPHAIKCIKCAT